MPKANENESGTPKTVDAPSAETLQRMMEELRRMQTQRPGMDQAAMIAAAVTAAVQALRAPTEEEQKKLDHIRAQRIENARIGEQIAAQEKELQRHCQHLKPNGDHTFRGQVHGDGWATIRCMRCLKEWRVMPTPEHVASGLNLGDIKGLQASHLDMWQKQSGAMASQQARYQEMLRKQNERMREGFQVTQQ